MAYGLKYQSQFTSQSDDNNAELDYTLQFLFKDYIGEVASITGADTTVIQKCTQDDPFAPIKGQSLSISLLNKGNSLPITAFQTDDDNGVQVKLLQGTNLLFIGFLVQDDFYETMVDYTHTITLSANDSLGLLKGVILSDAAVRRAFNMSFRTNGVDTVVYMYTEDAAFYPQAGNIIEILGNTYTIVTAINETTLIGIAYYNWTITLSATTGGIAQTVDIIYLTGEINLLNKNSLLSIIAVCLGQTNLSLITNIFLSLYEYRQDNTEDTFDQTLINSQVFIAGDTYMDCYSALEKVMQTFNCSLFQANGQWNIVHWHEAVPKQSWSYANNAIPSFIYNETWEQISTGVFSNNFNIGPSPQLTRPIAGLTQGALRGYKFTKKKFEYKQPKYLLRNYDLLEVGNLLRQYVSGVNTIYEYVAVSWENDLYTPVTERFIRVVRDTASGGELSRALVVRNQTFNAPTAVQAIPFEISEGDKVKFTFSIQTNFNAPGPGQIIFALGLDDGTTVYLNDPPPAGSGLWDSPNPSYNYFILSGDNFNIIHTVEIQSPQAPKSGLVYFYLPQPAPTPSNPAQETYYTDIRLEYQPYISDSTKIIGQTHTQTRATEVKLFDEQDIYIDDTPRNSIDGTLFLPTKTGLVQDRTTFWRYPPDANGWKLGELTTLEDLIWRKKTRSKLEGGFIGNYQSGIPISLLTVGITDFSPTKNYIFGLLTIDYKRNQFSGTMWELYDNTDTILEDDYEFKYLYSTT
jgi:hypothetical protein